MGLFGPKYPLDQHEWEWQLASFKWLLQEFEGIDRHKESPLILPTPEYFSIPSAEDERAEAIFTQVKHHADMDDWPTDLIIGDESRPQQALPWLSIVHDQNAPLGTFQLDQKDDEKFVAVISYNPIQTSKPTGLIATFAHELSHYLMVAAKSCPPGGWEVHELTTDLMSIFLGFGIFMGNNARDFSAFTSFDAQGWSNQSNGYLSERALMTGLAISETLAGRDPMAASEYLKKHLVKDLKMATKYLAKRDVYSEAMDIDLADFGVKPDASTAV